MKVELTPEQAQTAEQGLTMLLDQMILSGEQEEEVVRVAEFLWTSLVDLYN